MNTENKINEIITLAKQGDAKHQYALGRAYNTGNGIEQDFQKAFMWYTMAAEQGHSFAKKRLKELSKSYQHCSTLIANNPYRILGVYINSSTKEILANKTKVLAYTKVKKQIEMPTDLLVINSIPRTVQTINDSLANLSLPQDKIRHALFWFAKSSPSEEIALNHYKAGEKDKAIEIFSQIESFSSILNISLISLLTGDYSTCIKGYTTLIHTDEYRKQFFNAVVDKTFEIDEYILSQTLIDTLLEHYPDVEWQHIFYENGTDAEDDDYISEKFTTKLIQKIEDEIKKVKSTNNKNALSNFKAGHALIKSTKDAIEKLADMDTLDVRYTVIMDNLADAILQCGINYYNNSDEPDKARKSLVIQEYAQSIAQGSMAKERCDLNVGILLQIISDLPPDVVLADSQTINQLLDSFKRRPASIDSSIKLVKYCAPYIISIKEALGSKNAFYLRISTTIVKAALNNLIEEVNESQSKDIVGNIDIYKVKNTLIQAWTATLYLDKFDLEEEFKEDYLKNRSTLYSFIERINGFSITTSYGIIHQLKKTQEVNFDLRTEVEFFNDCKTEDDYNQYLNKYINPKFEAKAKTKLKAFRREREIKELNNCSTISEVELYIKNHPESEFLKEAREKLAKIEQEEVIFNEFKATISKIKTVDECIAKLKEKDYSTKFTNSLDNQCYRLCKNEDDYLKYLKYFSLHKEDAKKYVNRIIKQYITLGLGTVCLLLFFFTGFSLSLLVASIISINIIIVIWSIDLNFKTKNHE